MTHEQIHARSMREGLALVQKKLLAAKAEKQSRAAERAEANRSAAIRRMGSTLAARCFGYSPVSATAEAIADKAAAKAVRRFFNPKPTRKPEPTPGTANTGTGRKAGFSSFLQ